VDFILADMDFQKSHFQLLEEQYPVKFLGVKNQTYLEEAIQYLIASKHNAANVIGFDHRNLFELEPQLDFLDLVVWDGPERFIPVKTGQFKKYFTSSTIQLHAPENTMIEMKNSDGSFIFTIKHATIVEVPEGTTEFNSNGIFWIGEFFQ
jgi:hypothetical protein